MNIFFLNQSHIYQPTSHFSQPFEQRGHIIFLSEKILKNEYYDPVFRDYFLSEIKEKQIDIVFSMQFYPILSKLCNHTRLPYISWCTCSTKKHFLFSKETLYTTNYIFHTDTKWVEHLKKRGVPNITYLPHAFLPDTSVIPSQKEISFVTCRNQSAAAAYTQLLQRLDERTVGFLTGLLDAQEKIYGYNIIENALNEAVLQTLKASCPLSFSKDSFPSEEEAYAYTFLYPAVTALETLQITKLLEEHYLSKFSFQPESTSIGKINLLISSREVQNEIPFEVMQILGHGGFLITNFKNDYMNFFEPEKDFVYYESLVDLSEKLNYYLENDTEREQIARRAHQKIQQEHTLSKRMEQMCDILGI